MKGISITLLLLLLSLPLLASEPTVDLKSLYEQIDNAIDSSMQYTASREKSIGSLRRDYNKAKTPRLKYDKAFMLYKEYKSYVNDSAIAYLNRCIAVATAINRQDLVGNCLSLMAFQCSSAGMYTEALEFLGRVQPQSLDNFGKCNYYIAYNHVYQELNYYTLVDNMHQTYINKCKQYIDSLTKYVDKNSEEYLQGNEIYLYDHKLYDKALEVNDRRMAKVVPGSHGYAIVAYYRYLIYNIQNKTDMAKYWLAKSSLADIKNAVMDQASLISLANILNQEGDIDRSYKYIRFAWECNTKFKTRMRNWQILPILSVIDNNYQQQIKKTNNDLFTFTVSIGIMALLLLALLLFARKQNRKLKIARNELSKINNKLATLNIELSKANEEIDLSNKQLSAANSHLKESNRIKEEYIGRFLSMCSQYVDKLDNYRKLVNRKMKNKEMDELFKMTRSDEFKEKELEELYTNFDSVFLHLFPNFVDDFNSLLTPDVQMHPKEPNTLNTGIRIFALIRLGIDDSSKIAEFLHYSVNTIYNYRARIKNGALRDREQFENKIKKLGLSQ